jgi:Ca-activated chloride channel family protein
MLLVMEGNFFNSRSRYTQAISAYLKALRYPDARPYGELGLATVYAALDEGTVALERLDAAEAALADIPSEAQGELVYRLQYNRGVLQFKEGDYAGAEAAFRQALKTDNSRLEAKRNLELSRIAREREQRRTPLSPKVERDPLLDAGGVALFEYLYKKEQNQWKSREWIEELPPTGPDY